MKRIRAADLFKSSRRVGECKYDFSKAIQLKGKDGRDITKNGRPAGILSSCQQRKETTAIPVQTGCVAALYNEDEDVMESCEHENAQHEEENISVSENSISLSPEEVYINLLKEKEGIFCIDDGYRKFALQEYDTKRLTLKGSQFVFVTRKGISFMGDLRWVYKCSCDSVTSDLIDCCDDRMEVLYNDFKLRIPDCIHVRTLSSLLTQFDVQNEVDPVISGDGVEEEQVCDVQSPACEEISKLKDGLFLVLSQKDPGIIQQTPEGVKCLTCNCSVIRCKHLVKFTSENVENVNQTNERQSYRQKCYSHCRIPFHSTIQMQNTYSKPILERFPARNNIIELVPEVDTCDVCGHNVEMTDKKVTSNLFVNNQILQATVSIKKCVGCQKQFYFDGFSYCVLNMGRNIICHEILRRFMYYFLSGKSTIFTEYNVLKRTFTDAGYTDFNDKMNYQDFKEAWYAFLALLDIDYVNSFHCPQCGPDPETVVMDATSVAFRKELISWECLFSSDSDNMKPYDSIDKGRVKERTLFSKMVRKYLLDYIKPSKGMAKEQKEKLIKIIEIENESKEVVELMEYIFKQSIVRGDRYFVSAVWRDMIKILASANPFCSFLPPSEEFFSFLEEMFSKSEAVLQDDIVLQRLQTSVPVIFKLLMDLKRKFPFKEFRDCLPHFQQKVFDPFLRNSCPSEDPDHDDILSFFPSLPKIRKRGCFVADKKGLKEKGEFCTKFAKGHPSLLPGVFTMFCPHGICYGFEVMKLHESPDVPFTLLRTRFKTAPKLVVYDNACTLQVYCLNRDPTFFMETEFRVDGLHYKNHTACGPSFELKRYPQHTALNSQVVEQSNSRLQRVKGTLSYMTQANFIDHCRFYLWGQNQDAIEKMKSLQNIHVF